MTPCKNTKCDHYKEYEYESGTLKHPFLVDAKKDYCSARKGDKMHVIKDGVIICPLCSEFKAMDLCTEKAKKHSSAKMKKKVK